MRINQFYIYCLLTLFLAGCDTTIPSGEKLSKAEGEIAAKVAKLLTTMTLEDKCGEMTQLSIDMISVGDPYNLEKPHRLDSAKLRKVLVDSKVGSILNVGGNEYTKEYWYDIIKTIQDIAMNEKESGIPVLYGIDAVHGTNYTTGATLFPQQIALAATWNPEHARKMGEITAYETRASNIPWSFSPILDIGRNPLWSRIWETFGEDPLLAADMGQAIIEGYEGEDVGNQFKAAACMKHFLGYSLPYTGKDRTQALLPERQLREYVLPTFKRAVDAGAHTVMINSAEINGIPVHANPEILKDLLRKELGFKGVAVTDWEDIKYLYTRHRVAKDYKDAIRISINAGIDMSMVPMDLEFPVLLKELVEEGKIPMSRIDEAVGRILTLKYQLDLFEHPYYEISDYPKFGAGEHQKAAYEATLECITLLKNDKETLPLKTDVKVLVTGPMANSLNALNGAWTHTWQNNDPTYNTPGKPTILEAISEKIGRDHTTFVEGTTFDKAINIQAAVNAARSVNAVVVCLGEMPYTEKPGDIEDLYLPDAQADLVNALAKTGKPIILVLSEGRPRCISKFEANTNAVIMAYLSGNEGGRAIAEVLFGDYNPNGRLPFTYPRYPNSILPYDYRGTDKIDIHFGENAVNPQYPFGFGLSYTTFEYKNLTVNDTILKDNTPIEISIDVSNTGEYAGKEVVQLYVTDKVASITPAVKRLRGYQKIDLEEGATKTVTFTIKPEDLAFVGLDNEWIVEPGEFELHIGGMSKVFYYE